MQISAPNVLITAQQARQALPARATGSAVRPDQAANMPDRKEFAPLTFEKAQSPAAPMQPPTSPAPLGSKIDIRV